MDRRKIFTCLLLILISQLLASAQEGYSINVTIKGAANEKIRLAFHLGNEQYIKDSIITDASGKGRFKGEKALPAGVYMIVFPGNSYLEFLIDRDQRFDIFCNVSDPTGTIEFIKSDENERFIEYQRKWKALQDYAIALSSKLKETDPKSSESKKIRL